jgi:hypothetical protein
MRYGGFSPFFRADALLSVRLTADTPPRMGLQTKAGRAILDHL